MSSAGIAALNPTEEDSALALFRYDSFSNPQFCEEAIMIFLSMPGLATVPMRVMESESIASVKLKIQDYKGYKVKKQRLVCDGRELARSDSLVKDYGVGNGNVIHLVVRMSDLRMISVETSCGKKLQFQADGSRNVSYIKQQILDRGNGLVNLNGQRVLFDGEELDDQLQIADIHSERVIHLLVCDSAKVISETVGKDYELFIEATCFDEDTVLQKNEIIDNRILGRSSWIEPVVVNRKFELSSVIKGLVYSTSAGLDRGNTPVSSTEGSGGAYFMWDITGQRYVAVFKPTDEEPMAANNPRGLPLSPGKHGHVVKAAVSVSDSYRTRIRQGHAGIRWGHATWRVREWIRRRCAGDTPGFAGGHAVGDARLLLSFFCCFVLLSADSAQAIFPGVRVRTASPMRPFPSYRPSTPRSTSVVRSKSQSSTPATSTTARPTPCSTSGGATCCSREHPTPSSSTASTSRKTRWSLRSTRTARSAVPSWRRC